jgi:polysaccharide export outer membrane protein
MWKPRSMRDVAIRVGVICYPWDLHARDFRSPAILGPSQKYGRFVMANIVNWASRVKAGVQVFLAAVLVLMSCGAVAAQTTPAPPPAAGVPPAQTTAAEPAPAPSSVSNDYVIGPGDTIQVFVWRNPELTTTVPVRPDGKISTALVEDMIAVGKTPSQLARDIEKVLGEYVRSPQVNVIVTQPMSTFSQVRVIGQVARPQALPYREGMTVLDAILACGGLGPFAAANRSKVVRTEGGKQREIRTKVDDLVNKGALDQNVALKPGDVLVVPQSFF